MKKKELFTCEYCNTDYADKERAQQCEKNHKKDIEECIPVYNPLKLKVKFKGMDKYIEFHR